MLAILTERHDVGRDTEGATFVYCGICNKLLTTTRDRKRIGVTRNRREKHYCARCWEHNPSLKNKPWIIKVMDREGRIRRVR